MMNVQGILPQLSVWFLGLQPGLWGSSMTLIDRCLPVWPLVWPEPCTSHCQGGQDCSHPHEQRKLPHPRSNKAPLPSVTACHVLLLGGLYENVNCWFS